MDWLMENYRAQRKVRTAKMRENVQRRKGAIAESGGTVTNLQKALALLRAVANAERPLKIAEAAAAAEISRPTAYRLTQALVAEDLLARNADGRLQIGFEVLPLAAKVLDTTRVRGEAMPYLNELAKKTGERANLGIIYRNRVLYVAGAEKPTLPVLYSRFGKIAPAHCSAMGKVMLAQMGEQELKLLLGAAPLTAYTENTITSYTRLIEELETVRRAGYAINYAELSAGVYSIATLVRNGLGPVAALGLTGRDLDALRDALGALRDTAELISHRLEGG